MSKDAMKPLTGGTIMMVLLLLAGLAARGMMESRREEEESRERERLLMERGLSPAEKQRLRRQADPSKPAFDIEEAVHSLYTKAESGDAYAQAAYGMVMLDSLERGYRIVPEYEKVGRLLIGADYDRVMNEMQISGRRDTMQPAADYFADWFRRSALQGNAYGMCGMFQLSLGHPSLKVEPDYAEAVKWARLAALHAQATEAGLPPRFAALGRVTPPVAKEETGRLSPQELLQVEREVREFEPYKE